jgi:hypothetical protein
MPPEGPIRRWAAAHGIDQSRVFLIRRAIGRRGTKGLHYMRDAVKAAERRLPVFVRATVGEIERRWR